jgi:signal transduction histidine kinase
VRLTSTFLKRYRQAGAPPPRLERVLAVGRTFLTVTGLVAIYLDPTEPARLATLTYGVLMAYALYSVMVLIWMHGPVRVAPTHAVVLHSLDVLWASVLTFISDGPVSPFFLFFLFTAAAAAFRWGFRETIATVATTIGIFLVETVIASRGQWIGFSDVELEPMPLLLRIAYLLLTGFLLAYLSEQEKQSRAELAAIADLPHQPRLDLELRGSVTAVATGLLRAFSARAVYVVIRDQSAPASLWRLVAGQGGDTVDATERDELNDREEKAWLFPDPARAWHAVVAPEGRGALFAIDNGMWQLRRLQDSMPPLIAGDSASRTVTAVNIGLSPEWSGRIYLFDIAATDDLERAVHFLDAIAEHISPPLTNVLLHRRLRAQDSAAERARVARELHDGAIQSLIGIDMRLEALRRRKDLSTPADEEVHAVQRLLRGEVMALRELMQALRPIELDANEKLADVLAGIVERFRRDSGISARFVLSGEPPSLRPAAALEVVRLVQEALVNVRKHSRADNVLVRLLQDGAQCRVIIEDDGRGFDFDGCLSAGELDALRTGPAIIKERARALGAELAVHSEAGVGARIEVTLAAEPQS